MILKEGILFRQDFFFEKTLLTLLTFCDIVKNALLWQDMPSSLSKRSIRHER